MNRAIDTVFLDAGGVLVHPSWTRVSAALAGHGVVVSAAALAAAEPLAMHAIDEATVIGTTDDHARGWMYFNQVLRHVGMPLTDHTDAALEGLRAYHAEHNLWEHVAADVVPLLRTLRAADYRLVVVSNANGRLQRLFDRLDLTTWFDALLDSHDWGVEKPDARLFEYALERSGAERARTVHVGDLYHVDIVGARRAGLREGVLYDPGNLYPQADCPRLRQLADLPPWLASQQ